MEQLGARDRPGLQGSHEASEHLVALKVIRGELLTSPDAVRRFSGD